MKKHPGTAGLMPVKGTGCGIRPDPDAMPADTGFDFSAAQDLLADNTEPEGTKPDDQHQPTNVHRKGDNPGSEDQ
ncbi:hypothetical protein ACQUQU_07610 [Thalassolituus sp. LLYu03]|uniref:hypothetical protein n=1 Tax=Thalassolituus sp. LLYu03 TaxID=3421656 RepID=UPI003D2685FE